VLLSTLPHIPDRTFQIRGFVFAEGFHGIGGSKAPGMIQSIIQQATQMGANAVVDVTVVRTGEHNWAITGTAVAVA
jgi:hypothetical protein